jgi:hypothetical protein
MCGVLDVLASGPSGRRAMCDRLKRRDDPSGHEHGDQPRGLSGGAGTPRNFGSNTDAAPRIRIGGRFGPATPDAHSSRGAEFFFLVLTISDIVRSREDDQNRPVFSRYRLRQGAGRSRC